jgi:hypothetical protein
VCVLPLTRPRSFASALSLPRDDQPLRAQTVFLAASRGGRKKKKHGAGRHIQEGRRQQGQRPAPQERPRPQPSWQGRRDEARCVSSSCGGGPGNCCLFFFFSPAGRQPSQPLQDANPGPPSSTARTPLPSSLPPAPPLPGCFVRPPKKTAVRDAAADDAALTAAINARNEAKAAAAAAAAPGGRFTIVQAPAVADGGKAGRKGGGAAAPKGAPKTLVG